MKKKLIDNYKTFLKVICMILLKIKYSEAMLKPTLIKSPVLDAKMNVKFWGIALQIKEIQAFKYFFTKITLYFIQFAQKILAYFTKFSILNAKMHMKFWEDTEIYAFNVSWVL